MTILHKRKFFSSAIIQSLNKNKSRQPIKDNATAHKTREKIRLTTTHPSQIHTHTRINVSLSLSKTHTNTSTHIHIQTHTHLTHTLSLVSISLSLFLSHTHTHTYTSLSIYFVVAAQYCCFKFYKTKLYFSILSFKLNN